VHASQGSLDRFIRRVYRRLVVLRLLEWAGMGFAAGCAAALLLVILLRNSATSPLIVAAIMMGIGAGIGLIATLLRRPKMMDAAVEADRQLDLADLLATAWQLESSPSTESFEGAVLMIANDRAERLQPREVMLHRLGVRAWGGIGLAGALVLTLAIFVANPIDTEAATSAFLSPNGSAKQRDQKNVATASDTTGRRPNISADHPGGENDPLPGAGKTTDATANAARGQGTDTQNSNPNGAGSGSGQSTSTPDKSNPLNPGVNSSRTNNNGKAAAGVGNSSDNGNGASGNSARTSAGNSGKSPSAPAWKGDGWSAAQQAADNAISTGQIPPAYHELVREYFKR